MNQRMLMFLFAFTVFGAMVSCTKDAALNSELVLSTATNAQVSPTATSRNYPAEDCLLAGQELHKSNYPAVVTNYVQTNLSNARIDDVTLFSDNGTITYKVELKNETILVLDAAGNLLAQGFETELTIINIPQAIKDTIATSYPNQTIEEAEKGWTHTGQEVIGVELRNDTELLFDLNGTLLCTEQDQGNNDGGYNNDHDDDDVKLPTDLKALVEDYLATNFPGYILKEADLKSLCNGTPVAVATLKDANGMKRKAYFALDLNITLLQTSTKILSTALPAAVLNTISSTYPNLTLDKDAKLIELPDGTLQYEVELESNGNSTDLDVILAADGTVVCQE